MLNGLFSLLMVLSLLLNVMSCSQEADEVLTSDSSEIVTEAESEVAEENEAEGEENTGDESEEDVSVDSSSGSGSEDTSSASDGELIKDNEFTEIPSYYIFPNAEGKVIDTWLSTDGNVSAGETAIYIDFSKIDGVDLKAGDSLSVSMSLSNGNYGSLSGMEMWLDEEFVGYVEAFKGQNGSNREEFSSSVTIPSADEDGYQLYIKITDNASTIRIKNVIVTTSSAESESLSTSYASAVNVIEKTEYTTDSTLPDYYSFATSGEVNSNGWIRNINSGSNVESGSNAITVDLSAIDGTIKTGDKLYVSVNISNGNSSSDAAIGLYLCDSEIGVTDAFKGGQGSEIKTIKKSFIVPEAESESFKLYFYVTQGSTKVYIKNLEVKKYSLEK
ncbi:MAG: hypothetical protein K5786_03925 [Treponema sp.]|nr:hypothetical protein [Treponema sp.]